MINSKSEFNHPPVKRLELKNRAKINEKQTSNPRGINSKSDKKATLHLPEGQWTDEALKK